jgi:hypothetical protein
MMRSKENLLARLKEQLDFLRASLCAFYDGNFAESVRIATIIRTLVHESGGSKSLLKQVRPNGLELPILDQIGDWPSEKAIFRFAVSVRVGATIAPAVDLASTHYKLKSIGSWWNEEVFTFQSQLCRQLVYTRKKVILILANKEGGAHVDKHEDPDYNRLLTDMPVSFEHYGFPIATPNLARFLTAQSGAEMLESLKRHFFPDEDVPLKWEHGGDSRVDQYYVDQISAMPKLVLPAFPRLEIHVTKRP